MRARFGDLGMIKIVRVAAVSAVFCVASSFASVAQTQGQAQTSSRWEGFFVGVNAGYLAANDTLTKYASETGPGGLSTGRQLGLFPINNITNNGFIGGGQL